jgi:hypothetical protein
MSSFLSRLVWMSCCLSVGITTVHAAAAPDLQQMLTPIPLSEAQPLQARNPRALSPETLDAYSTPGAQAVGSTTQGTLVKVYAINHMRASEMLTLLSDPAMPLLPRDQAAA